VDEEGRGVVSVRQMSRVQGEQQKQVGIVGKEGVVRREGRNQLLLRDQHHRDSFQVNTGVYGAPAAGYGYGVRAELVVSTGNVEYRPT